MWSFAKGHGTQNDFVLVKDRHNMLSPSAADVRHLCDRRAGIGADGVLRVVRAGSTGEWEGDPDLWFMDYRNADGSVAEMCGNGLRVFVRYLIEENLVDGGTVRVATRAGLREVAVHNDGRLTGGMGTVRGRGTSTATVAGVTYTGTVVDVGNPHLVVEVGSPADVAAADLTGVPELDESVFPEGANIEIVAREGETLVMRVLERGVGETRSCGTGTVATAWAMAEGRPGTYKVRVPGGWLEVALAEDGTATLTGPAVIVARGEVAMPEKDREEH